MGWRWMPLIMKSFSFTLVLASFAAAGMASGIEVGEKPKTPKLPGVPYVVHDGTRPQPVKVKSGGAVSTKPPGDALVLIGEKSSDTWNGNNWPIVDGFPEVRITSGNLRMVRQRFVNFAG